jgi:hypothetical protein
MKKQSPIMPDLVTPAAAPKPPERLAPDVAELAADLQQLVRRLLVEGATFEEAVQAVNERGEAVGITLSAVQNYYRGDLALQQQRIQHQLQAAESLKKAMRHPRSDQAKLADAIILTGLTHLSNHHSPLTPKEALAARTQHENLNLKQQVLVLRRRKALQDLEISRHRARILSTQYQLARTKLHKLQREVEASVEGRQRLGPESLQKIREIYGLIAEAGGPQEGDHAPAQA